MMIHAQISAVCTHHSSESPERRSLGGEEFVAPRRHKDYLAPLQKLFSNLSIEGLISADFHTSTCLVAAGIVPSSSCPLSPPSPLAFKAL
jgi:hypothetical protein